MLKLLTKLKSIFQKEEQIKNEVIEIIKLPKWFNQKISKLELNNEIILFLQKINQLKLDLQQKITNLEQLQISEKDKQQVEARVRNIVEGHKDNYLKEIQRFENNLHPLQIENKSLEINELQQILEFNKQLDQNIENLAKRTAKSYQAAQHLFFDGVESIFKIIGELNLLIKNFQKQQQEIQMILETNNQIEKLQQIQDKKQQLKQQKDNKEKSLQQLEEQLEKEQSNLEKLKQSKDFSNYHNIKDRLEDYQKITKELEDQVYFYFSKLNKPLKKYERIAINNKRISKYLSDSIKSFHQDKELNIISDLTKLKQSLQNRSVNFDKKQTEKFIELIDMAENNYLEKIRKKIETNESEIERIKKNLNDEIIQKVEQQEQEIKITRNKIQNIEKELINLKKSSEFDNDRIKDLIKSNVEKTLQVKLEIS